MPLLNLIWADLKLLVFVGFTCDLGFTSQSWSTGQERVLLTALLGDLASSFMCRTCLLLLSHMIKPIFSLSLKSVLSLLTFLTNLPGKQQMKQHQHWAAFPYSILIFSLFSFPAPLSLSPSNFSLKPVREAGEEPTGSPWWTSNEWWRPRPFLPLVIPLFWIQSIVLPLVIPLFWIPSITKISDWHPYESPHNIRNLQNNWGSQENEEM